MSKKAVRDSKAGTLAPTAKESRASSENHHKQMQVSQGNVGLVVASLLNAMNNNLAEIKTLLEKAEKKLDG